MSGWAMAAQAGMQVADTGLQFWMGERAADAQKRMASQNRAFQYHMATHQYQHAMADMEKAGLNPILAGKFGGGGTPPGASAQIQPSIKGPTAAKDALMQVKQMELLDEQIKKTRAEGFFTDTAAAKNIKEQRILEQTEVSAKAAAAQARATEEFYDSDLGKWARMVDLVGKSLNPFVGSVNSAKSLTK